MEDTSVKETKHRWNWREALTLLVLLAGIATVLIIAEGAAFTALVFGSMLIWSIGSFAAILLLAWPLRRLKSRVRPLRSLLLSFVPLAGISAGMSAYGAHQLLTLSWASILISIFLYLPGLLIAWVRGR